MPNARGSAENFKVDKQKRKTEKAKRLAAGQPKHKDEKYMDKEELEAYIDLYLQLADGDIPDNDQVKIAKDMWKEKLKQGVNTSDVDKVNDIVKRGLDYAKSIRTTSTEPSNTSDE